MADGDERDFFSQRLQAKSSSNVVDAGSSFSVVDSPTTSSKTDSQQPKSNGQVIEVTDSAKSDNKRGTEEMKAEKKKSGKELTVESTDSRPPSQTPDTAKVGVFETKTAGHVVVGTLSTTTSNSRNVLMGVPINPELPPLPPYLTAAGYYQVALHRKPGKPLGLAVKACSDRYGRFAVSITRVEFKTPVISVDSRLVSVNGHGCSGQGPCNELLFLFLFL